ncbi:hypothetical protein V6N11_003345 [Hibiscus sabdariffa]|uniref:Uncharacterized protein n=1 Tax=Hibiscus sabdariffa TaxID=183260 RepID=A0ABR2SD08_9ROSI
MRLVSVPHSALMSNLTISFVFSFDNISCSPEDSLDLSVSHKHVEQTQQQDVTDVPESRARPNTSRSSSKKEKPTPLLLLHIAQTGDFFLNHPL